jgi:hypothetical protein
MEPITVEIDEAQLIALQAWEARRQRVPTEATLAEDLNRIEALIEVICPAEGHESERRELIDAICELQLDAGDVAVRSHEQLKEALNRHEAVYVDGDVLWNSPAHSGFRKIEAD